MPFDLAGDLDPVNIADAFCYYQQTRSDGWANESVLGKFVSNDGSDDENRWETVLLYTSPMHVMEMPLVLSG